MRVVLVAQIPQASHGLTELLRVLGHKPVALLCTREDAGRYGDDFVRPRARRARGAGRRDSRVA